MKLPCLVFSFIVIVLFVNGTMYLAIIKNDLESNQRWGTCRSTCQNITLMWTSKVVWVEHFLRTSFKPLFSQRASSHPKSCFTVWKQLSEYILWCKTVIFLFSTQPVFKVTRCFLCMSHPSKLRSYHMTLKLLFGTTYKAKTIFVYVKEFCNGLEILLVTL